MKNFPISKFTEEIVEQIGEIIGDQLHLRIHKSGTNQTYSNSLHFYNDHTFTNPWSPDLEKVCFKFLGLDRKFELHYCTIMYDMNGKLSVIDSSRKSGNRLLMVFGHIDFQRKFIALIDTLENASINSKNYVSDDLINSIRSNTY